MVKRITDHILSVLAAIVAIAGFISLLASAPVKAWVKAHSLWIFVALVISIAVAFVVVDYVNSRKRGEATVHDRKRVNDFLQDLPPDGQAIAWLKQDAVWNTLPCHVLDTLDTALREMDLDVIGLDSRPANQAYAALHRALEEFRSFVSLNLFMTRDYKRMVLSSEWSDKHRKEATDKINALQVTAVTAYDSFLTICHKKGLDRYSDFEPLQTTKQ